MIHNVSDSVINKASGSALEEARQAAAAGSFGVGGCLVTADGTILARARNKVTGVQSKRDPTAHAERRLIDWYYSRRARGRRLPPPSELLIVGTVEPCMMCAGALLSAGFSSFSLCADPPAGLAIASDFACLPHTLRPAARKQMALALHSDVGRSPKLEAYVKEAEAIFSATLASVRATVSRTAVLHASDVPFGQQISWGEALRQRSPSAQIAAIRVGDGEPVMPHARDANSAIGYPVLELIRTIAKRGIEDAPRDVDKKGLQVVVAGEFESPAAIVACLGAIGSFAEGPVTRTPYVMLEEVSEQHFAEVADALALFPPFYRETIGLSVGRAG